nr:hypothetical protein BaRGS_022522 [Batillaria attramentaria]
MSGRVQLVRVVGFLVLLLSLPLHVYLQVAQTPAVRDSLRLVNILTRRPIGEPSVRRSCHMLNTTEFERITGAINRAKRDTRIRPNVYDAFAFLHAHPDVNAGAHQGPGFLPFHRVLLFLFEKLLRMYDPTVSLCYWDSTVEPTVNDMAASATWTTNLFGNNQGTVQIGFAAGWDIELVLQQKTLGEISFPGGNIGNNMEEIHNYVHTFVGGLMGQVETASYDPIFWFHHAYIDCVYEWFRETQKAKGIDPMRDWPSEYGDRAHAPFAPMRLGSLRMIDGANNFFSNRTIRCMDPPGACISNADCGLYMRCNPATRRCISDTLSVTPTNAEDVRDLTALLNDMNAVSSINNLFNGFPSRGFNSVFQTPTLDSLTQDSVLAGGMVGNAWGKF